ncbi:MAG TPA: peptidylprolyl isomerase [Hyphomicrobiaceae bacterium]|nr:peptidylprolyl isomerase [Hyphomicrobiaceae bacterium]
MTTVLDTHAVAAAGCAAKPSRLSRPKPISVNGVVIAHAAISRETQNHPAEKPLDAWMAAARALVIRELLLQEACRLGLTPKPQSDEEGRRETDEEALMRELTEREIVTPTPDEATCRRVYELQRARFRSSDLYAARHILLAAAPDDAKRRQEARTVAEALLVEIGARPESFARLAAAHSACPSSAHGGNLGQISRGQTVPEFEAALATLELPGIVETRFGFHVVIVDQHVFGRELPFEVVRDRIAGWLAERSRHAAIRQFIAMLASRAEVTGLDLGVGNSALDQVMAS